MDMAGHQHRNFGGLAQKPVFFNLVDVPQQDDQIGAIMKRRGVLARRLDHGNGVPLFHQFRRAEGAEFFGHGADHRHAQAVDAEDHIRLRGEEAAAGAHEVAGDDGIVGGVDELAGLDPAIVKIVVTQSGGIEAEQVRDFEHR